MMKKVSRLLVVVGLIGMLVQGGAEELAPRIELDQVQVGGEIGRRIDITIDNNIHQIDIENDFLKPFQERERQGGYIGLGKFIDSLVRLAAYRPEEKLVNLKNWVIEETIQTQEEDGYIGLFEPEARMWKLWDIHEMAYIVNGLVSDYRFFGTEASLESGCALMDYIIRRWEANPEGLENISITVFMAVTGLEETLLMLYEHTGEERYVDFCRDFRKLPEWDYPIVQGRWGKIGGHAYAFLHRCLAQLRLHQMEAEEGLREQTERVIDFLRRQDGLLINGVCSQHECWHDTQDGTEGLGETCATAYLIRVLDELIRMDGESIYGDMMERSIYNGLFAAQSPDGRRLRYYVPFEGEREYFHGDTYCCPCNYRRIIAELPSMVYYRMGEGLAVNLFTSSKGELRLADGTKVEIQQETDYPNRGVINLLVEAEEEKAFPLYVRIPRWCKEGRITFEDGTQVQAQGGQFFPIRRVWGKGERLRLEFPMTLRLVKGRKAQAGRVAVMRGPQLFCMNPAINEGLEDVDFRQIIIDPETLEGPFRNEQVREEGMAVKVKGWKAMGFTTGGGHQIELTLTEFPDPEGEFTYFRVRRIGQVGVDDELIE